MSGSPGRPTLASVIVDADLGHLSDVTPLVHRGQDPFEGSCTACTHPPFIHSDRGRHRCLYAGCECPGFDLGPGRAAPVDEASEEAEPAPVVAVISKSYLVVARGARPGRPSSE
jgi:hypothetical protein